MKKKNLKALKVVKLTAATLVFGATATYGGEILSSVIERFQVGNTEITQYESNTKEQSVDGLTLEQMQEGFRGKLFDQEGNEVLYGECEDYYTQDGKWIESMMVKDLLNGGHEFIIYASEGVSGADKILSLEEVKEVAYKGINLPAYLPQGYSFKEATASFEGAGINVVYSNEVGDSIVLLASATKEATTGVATTDEVAETTIAGEKVTLSANSAFWESKAISYQMYWNFQDQDATEVPSMDIAEVSKILTSTMSH